MGVGVFGCVFMGILPDGRPVAVKKLKIGNRQGVCAFKAEVDTISRSTTTTTKPLSPKQVRVG